MGRRQSCLRAQTGLSAPHRAAIHCVASTLLSCSRVCGTEAWRVSDYVKAASLTLYDPKTLLGNVGAGMLLSLRTGDLRQSPFPSGASLAVSPCAM